MSVCHLNSPVTWLFFNIWWLIMSRVLYMWGFSNDGLNLSHRKNDCILQMHVRRRSELYLTYRSVFPPWERVAMLSHLMPRTRNRRSNASNTSVTTIPQLTQYPQCQLGGGACLVGVVMSIVCPTRLMGVEINGTHGSGLEYSVHIQGKNEYMLLRQPIKVNSLFLDRIQ